MEERLGANWLNKIGTAAFVIGFALLLNYSMHYLGPLGKIALGYFLSAALIVAGIIGEKKERYRIAGRAVLGGGWALGYFTTYALHNIAAVRLIGDPNLGFILLFLVAVAMVAHSLRYRSEVTTGFAYLLAYVSLGVSVIPPGALIGSAVLSASLIIILRARKWYILEPLAIIATYAVHWLWVDQIYDRLGGPKPFPEFKFSVALLTIYWATYLVSHFLRSDREPGEKQFLATSFILNAAGYLVLLQHQAFHPELKFWFLLALGIIYLCVSGFAQKAGRRLGFVLASTLGATLVVAAVPYRYSGFGLTIIWLAQTEAFLIAGWRLLDVHLRRVGWAAAGLLAAYVIYADVLPQTLISQVFFGHSADKQLGWLFFAMAAAFFLNSRLKNLLGDGCTDLDRIAAGLSPLPATTFLLAAAWVVLPAAWTAVAWVASAAALVVIGRRLRDTALYFCGHAAAALSLIRLLIINMESVESFHIVTLRAFTVTLSAALFYGVSRWTEPFEGAALQSLNSKDVSAKVRAGLGIISAVYTTAASFLFAVLIYREFTSAAIALAWGLFGLALIEAARTFENRPLLVQGRLLLVASFVRLFIADLNSTTLLGAQAIPVQLITVPILSGIFCFASFTEAKSSAIKSAMLWMALLSIAALVRFQIHAEWVAVAWALMAVLLYFAGGTAGLRTLRTQSFFMTLLVTARCVFDNFYRLEPWRFTNMRTATVVAAAALLYILFAAAQITKKSRMAAAASDWTDADANRSKLDEFQRDLAFLHTYHQHLFFFVPTVLLTVLLTLEVRRGFLTAAWGLEGLVVFLVVLRMDERAYRWFSLLLLLLCVGRVVIVDVWNFDALGRIISFMGLGVVLIAVSFLYARHREILRKVL